MDTEAALSSNAAAARRPTGHAVAVGISLLLVLTGCGGDADEEAAGRQPATTSAATATPAAAPSGLLTELPTSDDPAPIEAGTYRLPRDAWSDVDFSVTFPEGWSVQYGHDFLKNPDEPGELSFYAVVVDEIYDDACRGAGRPVAVGPGTDGLVAALLEQPGPKTSDPVDTTLGDSPATRIDLEVPRGLDLKSCRLFEDGVDGLQIWYSRPADKYLVLGREHPVSVYVLEVDGRRQVFLTGSSSAASDADLAELQSVLDSIRIEN